MESGSAEPATVPSSTPQPARYSTFETVYETSLESRSSLPLDSLPELTLKPTIMPTRQPSSETTVKPTPKPTAKPAAVSKKVVLAEGFYYMELDDALKARITGMSYPVDDKDCPVKYADLRYIKLLYYDFVGIVYDGELMIHARLADEVMAIFHDLYKAKYPLASVRLVDDYGEAADDNHSMADNNTSAFNYRRIAGSTTLSRHSYGAAIDINPMLNPYIVGDRISPANGAMYADRSLDFAGKIDHKDLCFKLFIAHGWTWGGDWSGDKDYQHFSKSLPK